jgi:hypothetical protein
MKLHTLLLGGGVLVLATAFAASGLNVKTGLWEVTYTSKIEGSLIPKSVLDSMPPEQRAKMEQAMAARAAGPPKAHKSQTCVTAEDLAKGAFDAEPEANCKNTLVSQSATHQEVKFECQEDGETRTGHMTVDVLSSETMKGNIEIVTENGKVSTQLNGKWIGAKCAEPAN